MDINDFRIVESALSGFYIERKRRDTTVNEVVNYKRSLFGYKPIYSTHKDLKEYWEEYYHPAMDKNEYGEATTLFNTKEDAISFLHKLCTPHKFYYPDSFE